MKTPSRRTATISLPPQLLKAVTSVAKSRGMTQSELFREAFRRFVRDEQEWDGLLRYGQTKGKLMGLDTDESVEKLIDESR